MPRSIVFPKFYELEGYAIERYNIGFYVDKEELLCMSHDTRII